MMIQIVNSNKLISNINKNSINRNNCFEKVDLIKKFPIWKIPKIRQLKILPAENKVSLDLKILAILRYLLHQIMTNSICIASKVLWWTKARWRNRIRNTSDIQDTIKLRKFKEVPKLLAINSWSRPRSSRFQLFFCSNRFLEAKLKVKGMPLALRLEYMPSRT